MTNGRRHVSSYFDPITVTGIVSQKVSSGGGGRGDRIRVCASLIAPDSNVLCRLQFKSEISRYVVCIVTARSSNCFSYSFCKRCITVSSGRGGWGELELAGKGGAGRGTEVDRTDLRVRRGRGRLRESRGPASPTRAPPLPRRRRPGGGLVTGEEAESRRSGTGGRVGDWGRGGRGRVSVALQQKFRLRTFPR